MTRHACLAELVAAVVLVYKPECMLVYKPEYEMKFAIARVTERGISNDKSNGQYKESEGMIGARPLRQHRAGGF